MKISTLPLAWHGLDLRLDLDGALYWAEEKLLVAADLIAEAISGEPGQEAML